MGLQECFEPVEFKGCNVENFTGKCVAIVPVSHALEVGKEHQSLYHNLHHLQGQVSQYFILR